MRPGAAARGPHGRRPRWTPTAAASANYSTRRCGAGARHIVVGLGGSACTDGGRGMVDALGGVTQALARLAGVDLIAATDVEHPLLGTWVPRASSDRRRVPIPTPSRARAAPDRLGRRTHRGVGTRRPRRARRRGRGGLGAALLALGGRRESGAAVIAEHTGLAADVAAAELIITGEGRFDDQSLHGKVVSALAAGARDTPVVVLAGQVTLDAADAARCGHRRGPLDRRLRGLDPARDRRRGKPADGPARQAANGGTPGWAGRIGSESGIAARQGTVEVVRA